MCDLLTNTPFTKDDIITIQDPNDVETKALANFHYLQEGLSVEEEKSTDPARNINVNSTSSRVLQQLKERAT
jgi:peptidyl-prolyl cis-trans isomerase-like protein 2